MSENEEHYVECTYDMRAQEIDVRIALHAVEQKKLEVKECELLVDKEKLELERLRVMQKNAEENKEKSWE